MKQNTKGDVDFSTITNYTPKNIHGIYTGPVLKEIARRKGEKDFSGRKLALGLIESDATSK